MNLHTLLILCSFAVSNMYNNTEPPHHSIRKRLIPCNAGRWYHAWPIFIMRHEEQCESGFPPSSQWVSCWTKIPEPCSSSPETHGNFTALLSIPDLFVARYLRATLCFDQARPPEWMGLGIEDPVVQANHIRWAEDEVKVLQCLQSYD